MISTEIADRANRSRITQRIDRNAPWQRAIYESGQDIDDTGGVHRTIAALVSIAVLVALGALRAMQRMSSKDQRIEVLRLLVHRWTGSPSTHPCRSWLR